MDIDSSLEFILQENKRYFEAFNQHDLEPEILVYLNNLHNYRSRLDERKMLSKETAYSWYRHRDIEL